MTYIIYLLVYVEDIIVIGSNNDIISVLVKRLNDYFALRDMGIMHYFLGIEVNPTSIGSLLIK